MVKPSKEIEASCSKDIAAGLGLGKADRPGQERLGQTGKNARSIELARPKVNR